MHDSILGILLYGKHVFKPGAHQLQAGMHLVSHVRTCVYEAIITRGVI